MPRDYPSVTDAELAILEILWDLGSATTRAITDRRYPGGGESDYATAQKLLQRLEAKQYVARDRSQFAHVMRATVSRTAFAGQQLHAMAKKLSGGSLAPLLTHLVEGKLLTKREREQIRKLLDDPQA